MGIYADRYGRRPALLVSVVLMCVGSLIIALCPGYDVIGTAAPVLLVVARLLQGLSVGGEYGTSATYLSEVATARDRGFYSSFQYVTLVAGQLVALALLIVLQQFVLTTQQLESWGGEFRSSSARRARWPPCACARRWRKRANSSGP